MKLEDQVSTVPGVGPAYVEKLKKLGINTIEDLLLHIPTRHMDFRNKTPISNLKIGEQATVTGQIISMENIYTRAGKMFQVAKVSDGNGEVMAVWMRQPFLTRVLPAGTFVSLSGRLGFWGKKRAFMFPLYEKFSGEFVQTGRLLPVYPETEGLSSKWLRSKLKEVVQSIELDDFLSTTDLSYLSLPDYKRALALAHLAESEDEFESGFKRLAFNELLMLQIENSLNKLWRLTNAKAYKLKIEQGHSLEFTKNLPFNLTNAQKSAIEDLFLDLQKDVPMNRLLEGDVGSGKTVVAASAMFASFVNAKKSVLLAPTQILAQQHFDTLRTILSPFKIRCSLVTSDGIVSDFGASDIMIGTHALLYKEAMVKDAALLVIDEQHRFGVKQRAKIAEIATTKSTMPHILTMTATPIPRTIALTLYGDLDLSTLDELPRGRKKIKTWVVPPVKRKAAEAWIKEQVAEGSQVFIVCPFIEESESEPLMEVKAATHEYERLKKVFPKLSLALLHGRMATREKNKILANFKNGKHDILVSTPVIEVGIDIPNATIMVIEAAERFGLAQLHQLRGRVGRGTKESYCLLFTESKNKTVKARLEKVAKATTGRELAELDLELRGPGEIFGVRQHGLPELKIAKWNDFELIMKSRELAEKVVADQVYYERTITYYRKKQITRN